MKGGAGKTKNRKIYFDGSMPDEMSHEDHLQSSYEILKEEDEKGVEIYRVNPSLFRELEYMATVSPDILSPRSEDLLRAFDLETFDRMVQQPQMFDPEETGKLLLNTNPTTKKDPEKYVAKAQPQGQAPMMPNQNPTSTPNTGILNQAMKSKTPSVNSPLVGMQ